MTRIFILIRGESGSGKSTLASWLFRAFSWRVREGNHVQLWRGDSFRSRALTQNAFAQALGFLEHGFPNAIPPSGHPTYRPQSPTFPSSSPPPLLRLVVYEGRLASWARWSPERFPEEVRAIQAQLRFPEKEVVIRRAQRRYRSLLRSKPAHEVSMPELICEAEAQVGKERKRIDRSVDAERPKFTETLVLPDPEKAQEALLQAISRGSA